MGLGKPFEPADILIHVQGRGIVLKDKSLIAFHKTSNKIIAFGAEAERIAEKDMENIMVISPLRQGMVVDYQVAVALFSHLLLKALGKKPILKPAVAVCVPKGITPVEKKTIVDVLIQAGGKEILVADIPIGQFIELYPKSKITIGITKDEPERYIRERLQDILAYAGQEQVPQEKIYSLLHELQR